MATTQQHNERTRTMVESVKSELQFAMEFTADRSMAVEIAREKTAAGWRAWAIALTELGWDGNLNPLI